MIRLAVIALALSGSPRLGHDRDTQRTGGRSVPSTAVPATLCNIVTADDKAGAWECMQGDGTMATGSATTFEPTGTPVNSTEGGMALRTYTSARNDQQASAAALPASDFTMCNHLRVNTLGVAQIGTFGAAGAAANYAFLPMETAANGSFTTYISDGAAASTQAVAAATLVAGTWHLVCISYERVGGAADNVLRIYVDGSLLATKSNTRLVQTLSSKWSTNGYVGASTGAAYATRGFFVTYKRLTDDDITRLTGGLAP